MGGNECKGAGVYFLGAEGPNLGHINCIWASGATWKKMSDWPLLIWEPTNLSALNKKLFAISSASRNLFGYTTAIIEYTDSTTGTIYPPKWPRSSPSKFSISPFSHFSKGSSPRAGLRSPVSFVMLAAPGIFGLLSPCRRLSVASWDWSADALRRSLGGGFCLPGVLSSVFSKGSRANGWGVPGSTT